MPCLQASSSLRRGTTLHRQGEETGGVRVRVVAGGSAAAPSHSGCRQAAGGRIPAGSHLQRLMPAASHHSSLTNWTAPQITNEAGPAKLLVLVQVTQT